MKTIPAPMRFIGSANGILMPISEAVVTIITGAGVRLGGSASPRNLDTVLTRSSARPIVPPGSTLLNLSIKDEEVWVE